MWSPFAHISKEKEGYKLTFEREFDVSAANLWRAITDPEELKYWFADMEIDFKKGGKIIIHFKDANQSTSTAKILSIDHEKNLKYDWEGELADWDIQAVSEHKSRLIFTYSKIHENYVRNVAAGFHSILDLLDERIKGSKNLNQFGSEEYDTIGIGLKVHYDYILFNKYPAAVIEQPFILVKDFDVPLKMLWQALTEHDMIRQWYFPLEEFKAEKGFKFTFEGEDSTGKKHKHLAEITILEPLKSLQYSWVYENVPGYSLLHWGVTGDEKKSVLKLCHFGLNNFQTKDPDFNSENYKEGWTHIIETSLANFLQKI